MVRSTALRRRRGRHFHTPKALPGSYSRNCRLPRNCVFRPPAALKVTLLTAPPQPFRRTSCRRPTIHCDTCRAPILARKCQHRRPLRFTHGRVVARLTAQHVERAPDATELFYKGPHDSTQTFEIGTPGLVIEEGQYHRARLQARQGRLSLRCLGLSYRLQKFHFKRFTGEVR